MVSLLTTPTGADERRPVMPKQLADLCAKAAYHHGIAVEPTRDERGRPTVILTKDAWTIEVSVEELAAILGEPQGMLEGVDE